jgi:hypothetical protein
MISPMTKEHKSLNKFFLSGHLLYCYKQVLDGVLILSTRVLIKPFHINMHNHLRRHFPLYGPWGHQSRFKIEVLQWLIVN